MKWSVGILKRVQKQIAKLPESVTKNLVVLILDIENNGPIRGNWPNFSAIGMGLYHCHIKKGKSTYVAVWKVKDKEIKLVEVIYAGTHEKAPY
ncbi:MAG: hypothetical protein J7K96_08990 [Desulfobacteraceae bacterium]|nr:hypothetical protein [Desulfobacteraceae bacterium]